MKNANIVKRWYDGKYIPPDNSPGSALVFLMGHHERHWSSRLAHWLVEFWQKEWKWIVGTTIAVSGLALALAKLP